MWEIYRIGLSLGLGIATGLLLCGLLAPRRALVFAVAAVAAAAGFGVGWAIGGWHEAIAGAAGGGLATLVAGPVTARTLEGGGTRSGTAVLFFASALVFAGVAFVPFLGYLDDLIIVRSEACNTTRSLVKSWWGSGSSRTRPDRSAPGPRERIIPSTSALSTSTSMRP